MLHADFLVTAAETTMRWVASNAGGAAGEMVAKESGSESPGTTHCTKELRDLFPSRFAVDCALLVEQNAGQFLAAEGGEPRIKKAFRCGLLSSSRLPANLRKRLHIRIADGFSTESKVTGYIDLRGSQDVSIGDESAASSLMDVFCLERNGG